jgi:pimeloyl-ACP methyl ester carboxylesterase
LPTVRTPLLEIAYEERNPNARKIVVLLHGFPDDAATWEGVLAAPELRTVRTLVPYLRGYGPTRFRDASTMRSGEIAALGRDVIEFLDALGIERCVLVGHDWGARAGYAAAVLAPDRIRHLIALSVGYGTNVPSQKISMPQNEYYWYQWFLATERGRAALSDERRAFCRYLWRTWSPSWHFEESEFERTAASFDNPDFVEIVLHSYRQRWGFVPGDPLYEHDRARLAPLPKIAVPTIVMAGADDGATLPEATEGIEKFFTDSFARELLSGVGHFIQRERPQAVADTIAAVLAGVPPV